MAGSAELREASELINAPVLMSRNEPASDPTEEGVMERDPTGKDFKDSKGHTVELSDPPSPARVGSAAFSTASCAQRAGSLRVHDPNSPRRDPRLAAAAAEAAAAASAPASRRATAITQRSVGRPTRGATYVLGDLRVGRPTCWATYVLGDLRVGRPTCWATYVLGDPRVGRPTCWATYVLGDLRVGRPTCWATYVLGDLRVGRPTCWATYVLGDLR
eukprot:gene34708-42131_t